MTTFRYEYLENIEPGSRGGGSLAIFERFGQLDPPYRDGDHLRVAYFGEVEADDRWAAAWEAFRIHNRDDRPTGSYVRSLSNGDVVRVWTRFGDDVYLALQQTGFVEVDEPAKVSIHPDRIAEEVTS